MQNNYTMVNFVKHQIEHEKRKKDELLSSNIFKVLEKENPIEYSKIMIYLNDKTSEEIENIIKYILNKKSVQKTNY